MSKHTAPLIVPDKIVTRADGVQEIWILWGYRRGDRLESIGDCNNPIMREQIKARRLEAVKHV